MKWDGPESNELWRIALAFVMNREVLSMEELRTLYLLGPVQFESHDKSSIFHVRTSLEAALGDIRPAVGRDDGGQLVHPERSQYWLGASGYLMVLDQLSTVFDYDNYERMLISLGELTPEEAGALYGLRNAFVHNYGLTNEGVGSLERRERLRHVFTLGHESPELVIFGDRSDVLSGPLWRLPPTYVDLIQLGNFVEDLVNTVRRHHMYGEPLNWRHESGESFGSQYFFWHTTGLPARRALA